MREFSVITTDKLIEEYSMLAEDPLVADYIAIREELFKRANKDGREQKTEFYKEACGYEYILELPYDELVICNSKAWVSHHSYSFKYKEPSGRTFDACLSLCGYTREQIISMIDKRIDRLIEESEVMGE